MLTPGRACRIPRRRPSGRSRIAALHRRRLGTCFRPHRARLAQVSTQRRPPRLRRGVGGRSVAGTRDTWSGRKGGETERRGVREALWEVPGGWGPWMARRDVPRKADGGLAAVAFSISPGSPSGSILSPLSAVHVTVSSRGRPVPHCSLHPRSARLVNSATQRRSSDWRPRQVGPLQGYCRVSTGRSECEFRATMRASQDKDERGGHRIEKGVALESGANEPFQIS